MCPSHEDRSFHSHAAALTWMKLALESSWEHLEQRFSAQRVTHGRVHALRLVVGEEKGEWTDLDVVDEERRLGADVQRRVPVGRSR